MLTHSQFESLERVSVDLIQDCHKCDGKLNEYDHVVILLL